MNMYKKLFFAMATTFAASSAMAADGQINFTGSVIAASCKVKPILGATGPGGGGEQVPGKQAINVNLGKVSADALGTGAGIAAGTNITLELNCTSAGGLSSVIMNFDPMNGSGNDEKNPKLLKTFGGAEGVGIALYDKDNQMLDLQANAKLTAPLEVDEQAGTATLQMRAGYAANGLTIKTGDANGTLPFTFTYL